MDGGRPQRPKNAGRRVRVLRFFAAAAVLLMVAILFVSASGPQESQLSAYSGHWNDLSEMRDVAEGLGLSSRCLLSGPKALSGAVPASSVLVIIGVEKGYTEEERNAIRAFCRAGGNLIIADDFGFGGELLESLTGRTIGLDTECLRDIWYQKNPDFVRVTARLSNSLGFPSVDLLLNRPGALRIDPQYIYWNASRYHIYSNPEVVANTSLHSWLDTNRNLERDRDEMESVYAVAALYTFDNHARMLAVSDPGLFVNDMIGRAFNRGFVVSALTSLGEHRTTVIFDESRHVAEGGLAGAGSAAVSAATGFSGNLPAIFVAFLVAFLLSLYQYTRLPTPTVRRHQDILGEPRLLHFRTPFLSPNEFQRLRVAIVEKVRLAYGMTPEEFYPAMLPRLRALLGDRALWYFLRYETWPDVYAFGVALQRAGWWTPPPAAAEYRPQAAPGEPVVYSEVEVVEEPADAPVGIDASQLWESGGVRIWDPGNRRGGGPSEADSLLYGGGASGASDGQPPASGGGGR